MRGKHAGYYCDIVKPPRILADGEIELTDLFLDLWVSPNLKFKVLDEEELENALGLMLFLIFSKGGPLGFLGLLYTPAAIILSEAVLVTPILISIMTSAVEAVDPEIMNLAKTLGASESQAAIAVLKEALNGVLLSNVASFNRAIAELGVALLVGGNIAGSTDVLTTAISRYTARGELDLALALGIFLMIIIFGINMAIITAQKLRWLSILGKSPQ